MGDDPKQYKEGVQAQIQALNKLKSIADTAEFKDYFSFLKDTATQKMISAFTSENIKTWEDFQRLRGEVASYLFPLQEVLGAEEMKKHLRSELDRYYPQS